MQCRSCRHDNPVGARFCVACGTRLAIACAACGVELPEGARFCPACGGAIEPTRATVAPAHAQGTKAKPPTPDRPTMSKFGSKLGNREAGALLGEMRQMVQ